MPLDSHQYLLSRGWSGKGSGLRAGAITRPLPTPRKRDLAGVGKDRDEAFPFWDHVFAAAAKSIKVKVHGDGEESDDDDERPSPVPLARTDTGLLSNRRPQGGSSTPSGSTSPIVDEAPRPNQISSAKREAARRSLYSRFFCGAVLGPEECSDVNRLKGMPTEIESATKKRKHSLDDREKASKEWIKMKDDKEKVKRKEKKGDGHGKKVPDILDPASAGDEDVTESGQPTAKSGKWIAEPETQTQTQAEWDLQGPVHLGMATSQGDGRATRKKKSKRKRSKDNPPSEGFFSKAH